MERLTQHVTSSGAGRRAALACGVERSPEEYEGGVLVGGALSAVGTGSTVASVGSDGGQRQRSAISDSDSGQRQGCEVLTSTRKGSRTRGVPRCS